MSFSVFVDKVFWALIAGGVWYGVQQLSEMSTSIGQLNQKMAVIVEQVNWHEKRIDTLESAKFRR